MRKHITAYNILPLLFLNTNIARKYFFIVRIKLSFCFFVFKE